MPWPDRAAMDTGLKALVRRDRKWLPDWTDGALTTTPPTWPDMIVWSQLGNTPMICQTLHRAILKLQICGYCQILWKMSQKRFYVIIGAIMLRLVEWTQLWPPSLKSVLSMKFLLRHSPEIVLRNIRYSKLEISLCCHLLVMFDCLKSWRGLANEIRLK